MLKPQIGQNFEPSEFWLASSQSAQHQLLQRGQRIRAVALARIGGLRCPSELQQLRWSDVKKDRFTVHSPKTEHHVGHAERDIPLFAKLQVELQKHFVAGNEFVIQGLQGTAWNLHEAFQEIARSAGIGTIKRPFDNMRMSRSNEVFERWGEAKGNLWIGHSAAVRKKHYKTRLSDEAFAEAASGG